MKRAKRAADAEQPVIPQAEWDFGGCPDEEAEACFLYEYARECEDLIADVAFHSHRVPKNREGRDLPAHPTPSKPTRSDDDFRALCLDLSWLWFLTDYFPGTPWLKIPKEQREKIRDRHLYYWKSRDPWTTIELSRRARPYAFQSRLHPVVDELRWEQGKGFQPATIHGREHSFHVIQVDLGLSDKELKQEFEIWLRELGRDTKRIREKRGRTSAKDRLRFLGAYRLLKCLSPMEAIEFTENFIRDKGSAPRALYAEVNAWYVARDKARSILENDFLQRLKKCR